MLLTSFNFIKPQLKVRRISIDNLIAKFHYRFTFLILMVCMILVTSRYLDHLYSCLLTFYVNVKLTKKNTQNFISFS